MNFYRRCLLIFVIAAVAGILSHFLLFFVNLGMPMEQERYLNEWLVKKDAYASSITGPKIVFASGSNTLFGVDARQIENTLGIPTVNYGVHASLYYYTLKRAQSQLHSGDIVVLPLEYPYYTWHHDVYDKEWALYMLGYAPEEIQRLSLFEKIKYVFQMDTGDLCKISYQQLVPPTPKETGYSSQYLNRNGDMTNNHREEKFSSDKLERTIKDSPFDEPPLTEDGRKELEDFISYCQANNITVYAAWPAYLCNGNEFSDVDLSGIHAIEDFYKSHNVDVLGNYTDCLYDVDLFYDTTYHLNEDGKRVHTDYLIKLLKEKIC